MNDNELFELCKEVYKRTGWETDNRLEDYEEVEWTKDQFKIRKTVDLPLYTSDYLLEKLPKEIDGYTVGVVWSNLEDLWRGEYGDNERHTVHADTPLKALLKLVIALDEAGELK